VQKLTRDEILANLQPLSDEEYDRVHQHYVIRPVCPTCDGLESYNYQGKTFECDCYLQRMLQKHYYAANIGREYHDLDIDEFFGDNRDLVVPKVHAYIDNIADNLHFGTGLTLTGDIGTGKTMAISVILKELIKRGIPCHMVRFNDLINAWGAAYKDETADALHWRMKSIPVLGLDELKTDPRNAAGFLGDGLEAVIRHRVSNLQPTLVTTNLTTDAFVREFPKAASLLGSRNELISLNGRSVRENEVKKEAFRLKDARERRPIC
jgi:DNA replication protein DnaC